MNEVLGSIPSTINRVNCRELLIKVLGFVFLRQGLIKVLNVRAETVKLKEENQRDTASYCSA